MPKDPTPELREILAGVLSRVGLDASYAIDTARLEPHEISAVRLLHRQPPADLLSLLLALTDFGCDVHISVQLTSEARGQTAGILYVTLDDDLAGLKEPDDDDPSSIRSPGPV